MKLYGFIIGICKTKISEVWKYF